MTHFASARQTTVQNDFLHVSTVDSGCFTKVGQSLVEPSTGPKYRHIPLTSCQPPEYWRVKHDTFRYLSSRMFVDLI